MHVAWLSSSVVAQALAQLRMQAVSLTNLAKPPLRRQRLRPLTPCSLRSWIASCASAASIVACSNGVRKRILLQGSKALFLSWPHACNKQPCVSAKQASIWSELARSTLAGANLL